MSFDEIKEIQTELEAEWPNLAQTHYRITSKHTAEYNCLAWVVYETELAHSKSLRIFFKRFLVSSSIKFPNMPLGESFCGF
jgi:hypothetical protein